MNTGAAPLPRHPAPDRHRVSAVASVYGLVGGPTAWFIQLCSGYALASYPCFPHEQRLPAPPVTEQWTFTVLVTVSVLAILAAAGAFLTARSAFNSTREEHEGDHRHLMEVGAGRTRFVALWGMVLGSGFAVTIAMTAVAFFLLPRCAG